MLITAASGEVASGLVQLSRARTLAHWQIVFDQDDPLVEDGGLNAILSGSWQSVFP